MIFGRMLFGHALRRATGGRVKPGRMYALIRLPILLRLAYHLFRDERVPLVLRMGTLGALALIFSPFDLVGDIPVIGQFWDFTVSVIVLEWFLKLAPAHVVNEHFTAPG